MGLTDYYLVIQVIYTLFKMHQDLSKVHELTEVPFKA